MTFFVLFVASGVDAEGESGFFQSREFEDRPDELAEAVRSISTLEAASEGPVVTPDAVEYALDWTMEQGYTHSTVRITPHVVLQVTDHTEARIRIPKVGKMSTPVAYTSPLPDGRIPVMTDGKKAVFSRAQVSETAAAVKNAASGEFHEFADAAAEAVSDYGRSVADAVMAPLRTPKFRERMARSRERVRKVGQYFAGIGRAVFADVRSE